MTRLPPGSPSWRRPQPREGDEARSFVVCRCGVDMEFVWPRDQEAVRCFGCGASFPRPAHLPAPVRFTWAPREDPPRARLARQLGRHLPLLVLVLLAGALLGLGVGLVIGR